LDRNVPLLVVCPKQSAAVQQTSPAHGARGALVVRELLGIIETLPE
jgi:hypothetical protein